MENGNTKNTQNIFYQGKLNISQQKSQPLHKSLLGDNVVIFNLCAVLYWCYNNLQLYSGDSFVLLQKKQQNKTKRNIFSFFAFILNPDISKYFTFLLFTF